eukprot:TRINITY_DN10861_c0_g1_i1.p1 TRINITY_DN10861_c0_g1~~TRINITY_DN10861_c0_g1_i1.p1  ORF type:complete len:152 (-),score=24.03 TRINITY_DN10861_c0_g1_i1:82-495(-)
MDAKLLFLFLFFLIPTIIAQSKTCPTGDDTIGCQPECVGDDGGPCCHETINNTTFCATYCLVEGYTCCGCAVDSDAIFTCGGCPEGSVCAYGNGTATKSTPGESWFCVSGASSLFSFSFVSFSFVVSILLSLSVLLN